MRDNLGHFVNGHSVIGFRDPKTGRFIKKVVWVEMQVDLHF